LGMAGIEMKGEVDKSTYLGSGTRIHFLNVHEYQSPARSRCTCRTVLPGCRRKRRLDPGAQIP
jgi:hypothetical protein